MSSPVIQANYDQLDAIAARFGQRAEAVTTLHGHVLRSYQALEDGGWIGRGFSAFSTEMQGEIFPALERLTHALDEARAVTLQVSAIMREAEEEAASLFQGGPQGDLLGGGGTPNNASVDNGRAGDGGRGNPWGMLIGGAIGGVIAGPVGTIIGGAIGGMGVGSVVAGATTAIPAVGGVLGAISSSPIHNEISSTVSNADILLEQFNKHLRHADTEQIFGTTGKVFKIAGYVTDVIDIGGAIANAENKWREATVQGFGFVGGEIGVWGGAAIGGVIGGAIGSIFPGPGTALGIVVGKIAGGYIGGVVGKEYGKSWGKQVGGYVYDNRESISRTINGFATNVHETVTRNIRGFAMGGFIGRMAGAFR